MSEDPPIVELIEIEKRYGGGALVLEKTNVRVQQGEFVSLLGPSGCGKSTLLKLIAGLSPVTNGSVAVNGKSPEAARDEMAFIFQDATLLPWLTVRGNVEMLLRLRRVPKARRRAVADGLLRRVRLAEVKGMFPRQLSGGMKMRVSIARALSLSPRILLLDEPFGALDEMTRNHLNEELLSIREDEAWTAVFVTHSVSEAVFLSNRILVMEANPGRIFGEVHVPFDYPRTAETRDTPEFARIVAEVSHLLRSAEAARHV